jgi:hypothetical protein
MENCTDVGAESYALHCGKNGSCFNQGPCSHRLTAPFSLGHRFCKDCWKGGLVAAISNDGQGCVGMRCMQSKCTELVTADVFQMFVPLEAFAKYQERLLSLFVEKAPAYKTCPTAGCNKIAFFQVGAVDIAFIVYETVQ